MRAQETKIDKPEHGLNELLMMKKTMRDTNPWVMAILDALTVNTKVRFKVRETYCMI